MDVEKQFLRLFMFSHKVSLPVVRTYFISSVLCQSDYNNDIVTFLEHHQHALFHLVGDYKCCQCPKLPSLQARCHTFRLSNDQFKKLYDVGNSTSGHFSKGSGGRIFQQCLCCITAKKDTNPKTYDLSLLIALINNCVKLSDNNMLWLETIRKCRNKLCHIHDINDLSKSELQTWWGKLECSVLNLAGEVHAQPAYKESIELLVDTFKYADYNRDTIAPLMEAMKAEINNNVNGVIQHQSEKLVDHMNTLSKQSEEQRNLDKKESQKQLLAVTTEISDTVEACHSEEKRVIELQTIELKGAFEKRQQREESLLCAIHKDVEIIKGNVMSHKRDQISFDIQLTNETNPTTSQECPIRHTEDTENVESKEKCIVELKISTQGSIGEKKEVIKQYFEKAVEGLNLVAPFEVKYVRDGSITIGTLLPVDILKNEEKFKSAICIFLDQMVTNCNIETSTPLMVKVKITILDHEQKGTVKCYIEETKQIIMVDKAVQAEPIMIDEIIESGTGEICPTCHNTGFCCDMKRSPTGRPRESKKEACPSTARGEPCERDTNHATAQVQTNDQHTIIYWRSPACEHMDLPDINRLGMNCHPESLSNPLANTREDRVSEMGNPLVVGKPNDEDIETQYLLLARSASTELELRPDSSYFSGSLSSRDCDACKLLMQNLNCEETKQFWREIDNEGPNPDHSCHVKFFNHFLERLKDAFPGEEGLKYKSTINLLKFLLKVDQKDPIAGINLSDLKRITDLFGPIKKQDDRCELIRQLHLLTKRSLKARDKDKRIKSSWFVGDMTRKEAEECLLTTDCKDKTYLVRISDIDGEDGDFALSVRHEDHCHHLKIQGNPKIALSESPYNARLKFAGREFSSLPEVIDYVTYEQEIEMDTEDETGDFHSCSKVICLLVFTKSPLNGAMIGYEKTK